MGLLLSQWCGRPPMTQVMELLTAFNDAMSQVTLVGSLVLYRLQEKRRRGWVRFPFHARGRSQKLGHGRVRRSRPARPLTASRTNGGDLSRFRRPPHQGWRDFELACRRAVSRASPQARLIPCQQRGALAGAHANVRSSQLARAQAPPPASAQAANEATPLARTARLPRISQALLRRAPHPSSPASAHADAANVLLGDGGLCAFDDGTAEERAQYVYGAVAALLALHSDGR
jgi:hypothetical protein